MWPVFPASMVWVSPIDYQNMMISLRPGMEKDRDEVIRQLIDIQYTRNDMDFHRGTFRVRGDVVEIFPADLRDTAVRVEFFGDEVDRITEVDVLTGEIKSRSGAYGDFSGFSLCGAAGEDRACRSGRLKRSWRSGCSYFKSEDKLLEAQRIAERTNFDIEMLRETGFCSGIENYSRHLAGLAAGTAAVYIDGLFPG